MFGRSTAPYTDKAIVNTNQPFRAIPTPAVWQQTGYFTQPPVIQRAKGYPGLQLKNGLETYTAALFSPYTAYGNQVTTWSPNYVRQSPLQLGPQYPKGGGPITVLSMQQQNGVLNAAVYGQQNLVNAASLSAQTMGGLPNG